MAEMDPAALQAVSAEVDAFNTRLRDEGAWAFAGGLHPPSTATTVEGYAVHASRVLQSRVEVRELQERPSE